MPDQIGPITELPTSEGPSLPYDLKLRVDVERAIQRSLTVASMGPRSIERGNKILRGFRQCSGCI